MKDIQTLIMFIPKIKILKSINNLDKKNYLNAREILYY